MNWIVRRILLITSAAAFLIAAPVVVLYSVGFRFQTPTSPTSVGVLLVESYPRRGNVIVDRNTIGRTPESVSSLTPGPVQVRVEKEGYAAWQKTINIEPNKATELREIRLFATDQPAKPIVEGAQLFALSPNRSLLITATDDERLVVFDELGTMIGQPLAVPHIPTSLLWSPDSTALIVSYGNGQREVIEVQDIGARRQTLPAITGARDIAWDPRLPGRLLFLRPNNDLVSFSLQTQAFSTIAEDIQAFAPTTRDIITVTSDNIIRWFSLTGQLRRSYDATKIQSVQKIAAASIGYIAISTSQGEIYIFSGDEEPILLSSNARIIGWSPDGTLLLVQADNNELVVHNIDNERLQYLPLGSHQTVVRLSRPIREAQWFAGGGHVIYQVDDEIVITEIDTRDVPISFTPDTTNIGNAQTAVGAQGDVLFYLKRLGSSQLLVMKSLIIPED